MTVDSLDSPDIGRQLLVGLPGTLCAPAVFNALESSLKGRVGIDALSWMSGDGPWDIHSVSEFVADHILATHRWPVVVAGHSTGGAIAIYLASSRPELVSGLLLINTGAHMRGHGDVDAIIEALSSDWTGTSHAILDRSFANPQTEDFRSVLEEYAASISPEAALEVLRSQRDLDLTGRLHSISVPTTVVYGTRDRVRTLDNAREMTEALPDSSLCVIDAGHTAQHEAPDHVAEAVLELLDRVAQSRG